DFLFSSRRRHTRSIRDWSSDVCSSDLGLEFYRKGTQDVGRSMEQVKNIKRQENELKARQQDLEVEQQQIAEKVKLVNELEEEITKIADEIDPQRPPISPAEELVLARGPESYGKWNEENEQRDFLPYVFTWLKRSEERRVENERGNEEEREML